MSYWVQQGRIADKWHARILQAAADRGIDLGVSTDPAEEAESEPESARSDLPIARYAGVLDVGSEISCYVLSDGRRVISRTSATGALTGIRGGGDLVSYVEVEVLAPYMAGRGVRLGEELVDFSLSNVTHKRVAGVTAEVFLKICRAYQDALAADAPLTVRQREIAIKAGIFLSACAEIGLSALIDEATGYQYQRAEDALQVKLKAFLEEEMRPWEKTFPDELWVQFGRLTGWKGSVQSRPKYWGHLVNELIYDHLDGDVAAWLKSNAPKPRHGQNYHQWLSGQYGLRRLMEHIWLVIGVASTCSTMHELRYRLAMRYGKQPVQMMLMVEPPGRS